MNARRTDGRTLLAAAGAVLLAGGCATFDIDDSVARTNAEVGSFTGGDLGLARTDADREARARLAAELLAAPLGRDEAVRLALVNSPAVQAMLAGRWAEGAEAAQSGRVPNPVFAYERLATEDDAEVEIERLFAFGLLDVLTLPWRQRVAERRIERARLQLAVDVVDRVTEVRRAWVEAVAAAQRLGYAEQVRESAAASAEMARRMESVGNFSRLARVRQQMFYADATADLAVARHEARAAREALVRLLGLDDAQADALVLPEQLPELPGTPLQPEDIARALNERRLDVRMARAELEAAGRARGLGRLTTLTDVEVGYRSATVFTDEGEEEAVTDIGGDAGRESADGYEIEIEVPLFDWGGMQRAALDARTLAAANAYAATLRSVGSSLRESYSAYRTSHDVAMHYREEILPLVETIEEENVLQYNGMFIGVFELLADSREAIGAVTAAIDAQRQFWNADAALQASMTGRPPTTTLTATAGGGGGGGGGGEDH